MGISRELENKIEEYFSNEYNRDMLKRTIKKRRKHRYDFEEIESANNESETDNIDESIEIFIDKLRKKACELDGKTIGIIGILYQTTYSAKELDEYFNNGKEEELRKDAHALLELGEIYTELFLAYYQNLVWFCKEILEVLLCHNSYQLFH